jgi:hypothetical protein
MAEERKEAMLMIVEGERDAIVLLDKKKES